MSFTSPQKRSSTSSLSPSHKKQKMSLTQTYFLAHTARSKLSKEASRGDHNLRRLVGHANLLDGLMIDLLEAERAQEALFNASARQTQVQWAPEPSRQPTIIEDNEEEDSESDYEDEMEQPIAQISARQPVMSTDDLEDEEDDQATDDEEDDYDHLALVRTPSRSSPPELFHEMDEDSDEESLPSTPSSPDMQLSMVTVPTKKGPKEAMEEALYEDGFYLPTRQSVAVY